MDVFIVRPFGLKEGIDFDRMEAVLIRPVLKELGLDGGTTGEIVRAGNIRADMMERLLTADLVIADISIQNANVYYELGVRHALRERPTILIRCKAHDIPFDLKTDRYLEYEKSDPTQAIPALRDTIRATLNSGVVDSPVYQLLPEIEAQDVSNFHAVPRSFFEAVEQAATKKDVVELGLLATESGRCTWRISGLRLVGRALFDLRAWSQARNLWVLIRSERPDDTEANLKLGTIYQRLGELTLSSQALERVLQTRTLRSYDRAEARSLRARNFKTEWVTRWRDLEVAEQRQRVALQSTRLIDAAAEYQSAFLEDLNHCYSGLNALAIHTILIDLACRFPDVWAARFAEGDDEADRELSRYRKQSERLVATVDLSLMAAREHCKRDGLIDPWLEVSFADYRFLTKRDRPDSVKQGYADAKARIAKEFPTESAARQLTLFWDLGILENNAKAALTELGFSTGIRDKHRELGPRNLVIVSTGHRIDAPRRSAPRFPADHETAARAAITKAVQTEIAMTRGKVIGIAGLASGNDILFQEICEELGVQTTAFLAIPRAEYEMRSVQASGHDWVARFRQLDERLNSIVLQETDELPLWMRDRAEYGIFQRGNIWMLEWAFAQENSDVVLIALWDGKTGDGPGGTGDMVALAKDRGARVIVLDTVRLFETAHSKHGADDE